MNEMNKDVPSELDFVREGHSAERVARDLAHRKDIRIPEIIWEH